MKEGASGLFAGLKVSLIRDVPFAGLFYPIYNFFKWYYAMMLGFDQEQRAGAQSNRYFNLAVVTSLASFSANAASCVITNPLDLIRTRAYFQYHNADKTQHYDGVLNAFRKVYEQEGMKGYFRGLMPRIMRKGFGSVICWCFFEYLIDKKDAMIFS